MTVVSRFLLPCESLDSTREEMALTAFERLFRERGLCQNASNNSIETRVPSHRYASVE
jgi:hypothetical protein